MKGHYKFAILEKKKTQLILDICKNYMHDKFIVYYKLFLYIQCTFPLFFWLQS